ncbi:MAG TPA: nucleoside hydrolase [Chitinophagaceae bacterium]|nr:nucleoside hydrolase [Chitinophagaceae bacterium]
MKYKLLFALCLLNITVPVSSQKKVNPIPIIFDSDMGPDYDDVGAIAILHAYADSGYARILATVASTKYEGVAAIFSVLNTYFNRPGIPIGVPKGNASELRDPQHWTDSLLVSYPHTIKRNDEVPSATEIYRKTLALQPDKSVVIVTTGFLTNLANLLQSPADKYSKLDGKELVRRKVKQLVCMGGRFPSGSEFNIRIDAAASRFVAKHWPTPVLLSGVEIGLKIKSGLPLINNESIRNSPVKDVFRICIPMTPDDREGRMSWDETAVLVAIKGYKPWYKIKSGRIIVNSDGSNSWSWDGSSHNYLEEALPPSVPEQLINKLIMHQPVIK